MQASKILRGLAYCASGGKSEHHPCNEEADRTFLKLMPRLQCIDIGANPLFVPFDKIIHGKLTSSTAASFRQAQVAHCTGLVGRVFNTATIESMKSIKSWVSCGSQVEHIVDRVAPDVELVHIEVQWPPHARRLEMPYKVLLTSQMVDVAITLSVPGATLYLHGSPNASMKSLQVTSTVVSIHLDLLSELELIFGSAGPQHCGYDYYFGHCVYGPGCVVLHPQTAGEPVALHCQKQ